MLNYVVYYCGLACAVGMVICMVPLGSGRSGVRQLIGLWLSVAASGLVATATILSLQLWGSRMIAPCIPVVVSLCVAIALSAQSRWRTAPVVLLAPAIFLQTVCGSLLEFGIAWHEASGYLIVETSFETVECLAQAAFAAFALCVFDKCFSLFQKCDTGRLLTRIACVLLFAAAVVLRWSTSILWFNVDRYWTVYTAVALGVITLSALIEVWDTIRWPLRVVAVLSLAVLAVIFFCADDAFFERIVDSTIASYGEIALTQVQVTLSTPLCGLELPDVSALAPYESYSLTGAAFAFGSLGLAVCLAVLALLVAALVARWRTNGRPILLATACILAGSTVVALGGQLSLLPFNCARVPFLSGESWANATILFLVLMSLLSSNSADIEANPDSCDADSDEYNEIVHK